MTTFFIGLSLGLLINRYSKKPLVQWPLGCWFLGHRLSKDTYWVCQRCRFQYQDEWDRWTRTFWTA